MLCVCLCRYFVSVCMCVVQVYQAVDRQGQRVAIKRIRNLFRNCADAKRILREVLSALLLCLFRIELAVGQVRRCSGARVQLSHLSFGSFSPSPSPSPSLSLTHTHIHTLNAVANFAHVA